jgi:nucleotide-binding universal stress UspA family protein
VKIVVGVRPDASGDDALACAEALARTMRARVVLATVHPAPWHGSGDDEVDAEWRAYLAEQARAALEGALRRLAPGTDHELRVYARDSVGRGLAEVADTVGASLVVIGSAGRGIGATADQLLHGATVPVLLVPPGFREVAVATMPTRVTVAYQRGLDSDEALRAAAQLCRRTGAPLRLVTLVLRPPRLLAGFQRALDAQRAAARDWLDEAAAEAPFSTRLTAEVVEGDDVDEAVGAVDLQPDELLVCGSGAAGPLRRVFLGDTGRAILRAATVPVLVVPRHAEPDLERTRSIPRVG